MVLSNQSRGCRLLPLALSLAALAITACDRSDLGPAAIGTAHPVSGRVLIGGKPAEGVEVQLHPLNHYHDTSVPHPQGTTDKDGRFQLHTGSAQEGAPSGQYVATLVWPAQGGTDRLSGVFAEPEGSGLAVVIEDETKDLPPFEVGANATRKKPGTRSR